MSMNGAYFNGLDADGQQGALANIPGSVTTDYILFSLNVASGSSADINYGWNFGCVLARDGQVTPETAKIFSSIVQAGVDKGKCQRVWLSIGAAVWVNPPPEHPEYTQMTETFTNIQTIFNTGGKLKSTLLANFGAIAKALKDITGVQSVGFDMDYEESGQTLTSCVANVTSALYDQFKCPVTFCPYADQSAWIAALKQVYSTVNEGKEKATWTQPVVGFNLQTYAGGGSNNPAQWADAIKDAGETGVADAAAFVWPIVSCDDFATPVTPADQVAAQLTNWVYRGVETNFHAKGASLWATQPPEQPPADLKAYSAAIAQGIA